MKKNLVFLLLVFLLGGCIKEDLSNCNRGLRLQFLYTLNNRNTDLLAEQVKDIRVYMFDKSTGLLSNIVRVGADGIKRGYVNAQIPDGLYTMVAWAGSEEDMMQKGYTANATVGSTKLDDFRMMMTTEPLKNNPFAEVKHQSPYFGDLFFAMVEDVSVAKDAGVGQQQSVTFPLIKNTSILRVIVSGLDRLTRSEELPLDIFTTGQNWRHCYNDAIDGLPAKSLYLPYYNTMSGDVMQTEIRQQRLDISQSTTSPVLLHVRNTASDSDIIAPLNLISAIRQNPVYRTQQDIDREDLFVVELFIQPDFSIKIIINEWEIIDLIPIV